MEKIPKYASLIAIIPLVMLSFVVFSAEDVFAAKAEGSPGAVSPKSYGSATDEIVCGDKLCSEIESNESG